MNSLADDVKGKCDAGHRKELVTSDSAKWKSLYLRSREKAYSPESFPIDAFANPSIILVLERSFRISHSEARWRKIDHTRGTTRIESDQPRYSGSVAIATPATSCRFGSASICS